MRQRSRASGKSVKARRGKAALLGRRNAPKPTRPRKSSTAGQDREIVRLAGELREALEQQRATSEVLRVISSSRGELEPVFKAILEAATRIGEAAFGNLFLCEGPIFQTVGAVHGQQGYAEYWRHEVVDVRDNPGIPLDRIAKTKQVVHIPDLGTDSSNIPRNERIVSLVKTAGARSFVAVPMLKDGEVIGAIAMYRREVRPFSDSQIELVGSFAAQAVIAIENTRLLNELRQRTDDLTESLEQQTATSEVLSVISSSPGDLEPVFNAMLENAVRICEAHSGTLALREDDGFRVVALHGAPAGFSEARSRQPIIRFEPGHHINRLVQTKGVVHVPDLAAEPAAAPHLAKFAGARTLLTVPMLKDNEVIGGFGIYRQEVRPFTDKQIALVQNFAAQAVIAIENTRLLHELRQRTSDLTESLEQQTATSEVLRVISGSPGELEPVFNAMLENAVRICDAKFGIMFRYDSETFDPVALFGVLPDHAEYLRQRGSFRPAVDTPLDRLLRTNVVVSITDNSAESVPSAPLTLGGARSLIAVPMFKESVLIGAITIYRQEVSSFTDKQIALVQNFAAQAVIAIENTRLLNELRESLEQQTATSEVLKVISSSPGAQEPVFKSLLENATRICSANFGNMFLYENEAFRAVAMHNAPEAYVKARSSGPIRRPPSASGLGRLVMTREVSQTIDLKAEPSYADGDPFAVSGVELAGIRTMLAVPMLKDRDLIGAIVIYRQEVRPFTDKQIELLTNFAAQAVIAIENTRLLGELRESLQQQTATADVLKIISRSTFDLKLVLTTLVESAARLCEADIVVMNRLEERAYHVAASYGLSSSQEGAIANLPIATGRGTITGRAALECRCVHVSDIEVDPEFTMKEWYATVGSRSMLGVPLLREGIPIGVIVLMRRAVRPFADKQIELAQTFADQAVIAIENVRLFEAEQQRTRELAKSLDDLRTAQDRLVQTEKLASLGQLTAGIAHEIKNPLNFVNNFSAVSVELIDELREALGGANLDAKLRVEIGEIADMLQGNLDKVVQHGKRADSIVKNMLLHSREGSGEHRPVDINALVDESLNLAYHGARAEKPSFNINLERSFDPAAGEVDLFPQEITRVLLNLVSNGFYAATKRKAEADGAYEPTLSAATKNLGSSVEIRIRDNGTGIPPEVQEKMFNPFFTTKPAGEGTGLGLSISHDIIVKQHGGSIEVDTQPGAYTEFRIVLPRGAATNAKPGERA